jgi:hypothetical protein
MKKIYLLICTLVFSVTVNAGIKTWVGGANGDWQWAANWSPQGYPGPTDDLIIENATVNLYGSAIVKSISLEGTAQLIVWGDASGNSVLSIPQPGTGVSAISLNTGTKLKVYATLSIGGGATANIQAGLDASDADISIEYGGKITIDRCQFGVYLTFGSTLTNGGNLEIGQQAAITSRAIYMDEATLQNNGYGIIRIDNVQGPAIATFTSAKAAGLRNINNSGTIYIGETGNITGAGISATDAAVTNSGSLQIDRAANGMVLTRGSLTNNGNSYLVTGGTTAVTGAGIVTSGTAITNSGNIRLNRTGGDGLQLTGGTLTNNGNINLGFLQMGVAGNLYSGNCGGIGIHTNGTTLSNNYYIYLGTVAGNAMQMENASSFTNSGVITGDDAWTYNPYVTAVSGNTMVLKSSTFINAASGQYYAYNSTYSMTDSAIAMSGSSHVENRGTLRTSGPQTGLSLDGVSDFKNSGSLETDGATRGLYLAGGSKFDNNTGGIIHFGWTSYAGGASLVYITGIGSAFTNRNALLVNQAVNGSAGIIIDQQGKLLNEAEGSVVIYGTGTGFEINNNGRFDNDGGIIDLHDNNISLHANTGGQINNNGTLTIGNGTVNSGTGIFIEGSNTRFSNEASGEITVSRVAAANNGILVTTSALFLNNGKITWGSSSLAFPGATALRVVTGGTFDHHHQAYSILEFVNCSGDAIVSDATSSPTGSRLTLNGIIRFGAVTGRGFYNSDATYVFSNTGTFETTTGGKMNLQAKIDNTGSTSKLSNTDGTVTMGYPFSNSGIITNSGTVTNTGAFTNASGGLVTNNGTWNMTGAFNNNANSTSKGSGTFQGSVFNNAGTVAPGNSPGCLATANGYNNQSTGTLDIEVNGKTTACTNFDRLNVTGTAGLSGALKVTFGGGYTAAVGDVITILKSTALSGTFSSNNLPAGWNVLYNYPATGDVSLNRGGLIPLTLLDFNAEKAGEKAKLSWTTTDEINTDHFELQKSNDGTQFQKLATIPAMNTAGNHHYQFTDPLPLPGRSYYRLKMVDIDGQYTYSRIAPLDFGKTQTLISAIYPNPVKDIVNIAVSEEANNRFIQLISQDGKIILTKQLAARGVYQLDLSALSAGIYLVKTSTGEIYKLVKQ